MGALEFTPIHFAQIDESETKSSAKHPGQFDIAVRFNKPAGQKWIDFFHASWAHLSLPYPVTYDPNTKYVKVTCKEEDFEQVVLPQLKQALDSANRDYGQMIEQESAAIDEAMAKAEADRKVIKRLGAIKLD